MSSTVETIVNTYNLFVDSSRGNSSDSTGDNYNLNLGNAKIVCDEGQYIRMTLIQFGMHKTWTDINATNCNFTVRLNNNAYSSNGTLTKRNNTSLYTLAKDFALKLGKTIQTALGSANNFLIGDGVNTPATDISPADSTSSVGGDSNYIISFTLYCVNSSNVQQNHGVTNALCQFFLAQGDTHEILGGNRVETSADTTTSSITITIPTATSIKVQCLYPAQRHTNDYIYLRSYGTPNTSLETLGLTNFNDTHSTDVTDSYILAKIPTDVEYCVFEAQSNREYFMNVCQKIVNNFRLKLTDRHARPLARAYGDTSKTAAGTGTTQSTLGNLSFSAVIRIDIVHGFPTTGVSNDEP